MLQIGQHGGGARGGLLLAFLRLDQLQHALDAEQGLRPRRRHVDHAFQSLKRAQHLAERRGVEPDLAAPVYALCAQVDRHAAPRQVLGDGLPGRADLMPHGQPGADLEQRLTVPLGQLVQDDPPGRVGQRPEQSVGTGGLGHTTPQ